MPHCSFAVNNLCLVSWKALAVSILLYRASFMERFLQAGMATSTIQKYGSTILQTLISKIMKVFTTTTTTTSLCDIPLFYYQ